MSGPKTAPILIIGGGAFGISTVFHLLEAGFSDITVLDKDDEIPSRFSAANDLNKIVRAEYEDPFYTELTLKAIEAWKTPLFAPHFHQTGFLHCVSAEAQKEATDTLNRFRVSAERHHKIRPKVIPINGADAIRDLVWQYQEASLPGWHGYLNLMDGYAHSGNAVKGLYNHVRKRGVKFILGEDGAVAQIIYEKTAHGQRGKGVMTATGRFLPASIIIVAAGAGASKLIPAIGTQLVAKSWSVAHVHLSDDEASALRGIPVTYARDLGFFFEPDPKTNLLKLCPMGGGYINTDPKTGVSHAPDSIEESAFLPEHDEAQLRRLLAQTLPSLADRPLVKKSLCWFADTKDSDFIIDYVPGTDSSVIALSGDSGHGFKMFPIFGSWVKDLLLAADGKQQESRWRWKTPASNGDSTNWGGSVSWRLGESLELADIQPAGKSKL
ncbi:FAD dependent oxidoreductase [Mariannaea sp. PMI_226]|nr:FAD dependent oxidoreductase [Mariannaea sp. PMI_226]